MDYREIRQAFQQREAGSVLSSPVRRQKVLHACCMIFCAAAAVAAVANNAPVVSVSATDTLPSTGLVIVLQGWAVDDSTPFDLLTFRWALKSGPAPVQWGDSASYTTTAMFTDAGVYVIELEAFDGESSGRASVTITVRQKLPFVVLAPANNAEVRIGKPFTVRWQMDPSLACDIYYSIDGGLSWKKINNDGAASDSCIWHVDDPDFIDGTHGMILVEEYQVKQNNATGTFVLVNHQPRVITSGRSKSESPLRVAFAKNGALSVKGLTGEHGAVIRIYEGNGAMLLNTPVDDSVFGSINYAQKLRKILLYQITTGSVTHTGMIISCP